MQKDEPLTPRQQIAMHALLTQAQWFAGYFNRQAARVIEEPANEH